MAKKADLLAEAKTLNLDVSEKNTIAEIQAAIKEATNGTTEKSPQAEIKTDQQEQGQKVADKPAETEVKTAKAGKRSAKALKEAEEKLAKEARKASGEVEADDKPKQPKNPTRSKLERRGKKYRKAAEAIEKNKLYSLEEALELATKTSPVKFDATVELHIRLGVDPRHADQNIRGSIVLPAGTGKKVRVAAFVDGDNIEAAKKAEADVVGADDILKKLDKGIIEFDVLVATPSMMPRLGKYARTLGPKGLMPNPKSGTVTNDVARAIKESKAGRVEYRVDSTGIVHIGVGKVSFSQGDLIKNARTLTAGIKAAKPASIKGTYVKAAFVATTMGPSIPVEPSSVL